MSLFPLMKLPYELQDEILSYLDRTSLLRIRRTCKYFHKNDRFLAQAFRESSLKLSKENSKSFLNFCKDPSKAALIEDFTLSIFMEDLGYDTFELKWNKDEYKDEELPKPILNTLRAVPKYLTNLTRLCVEYDEGIKWDVTETNEGFYWEAYVKTLGCIFPPDGIITLEDDDEDSDNENEDKASDDENKTNDADAPSEPATNSPSTLTPIFPNLKTLILTEIDAIETDAYYSRTLRDLLRRIENFHVHFAMDTDIEGAYCQDYITNFNAGAIEDTFILPLQSPIRTLDVRFPTQVWCNIVFQNIDNLKENLTSLYLQNFIFAGSEVDFIGEYKNLEKLTLNGCDIQIDEDGTLESTAVFWYDLWETLIKRGRSFKRLRLVDSEYCRLDLGWGFFKLQPDEYGNDPAFIKEVYRRDREGYIALGGIEEEEEEETKSRR